MASNRADLFQRSHKILKKHFTPAVPNSRLPLFEQLIFACCLEDGTHEAAQEAFSKLEEQCFDWNEVRVSTVTELSEVMAILPKPRSAARRVKQVLQSVFEDAYAFELEKLKKQNIGVAVKTLSQYTGTTSFTVAHATQNSLGGHSIPVGQGALEVLFIIGAITEKEKAAGMVPGLERAIPKNKGIEYGSLLNQMGVELQRAPQAPATRNILIEITPDAKDRLPKRRTKPAAPEKPAAKSSAKATKKATRPAAKKPAKAASKAASKTAAKSTKKAKATPKKKPIKKTVTIKRKKVAGKVARKGLPVKKKKKIVKPKKVVSKRITKRKPK